MNWDERGEEGWDNKLQSGVPVHVKDSLVFAYNNIYFIQFKLLFLIFHQPNRYFLVELKFLSRNALILVAEHVQWSKNDKFCKIISKELKNSNKM